MELFATHLDYKPVIEQVEAYNELKYIEMGLFESPEPRIMYSALSLSTLGVSRTGNSLFDERYLVALRDASIKTRIVSQRRGGTLYALDMQVNPLGVTFGPSCLFQEKCLIRGYMSPSSKHPDAQNLFKRFRYEIKKRFICINGVNWVGPEALEMHKAGLPLKYRVSSDFLVQDLRLNK